MFPFVAQAAATSARVPRLHMKFMWHAQLLEEFAVVVRWPNAVQVHHHEPTVFVLLPEGQAALQQPLLRVL